MRSPDIPPLNSGIVYCFDLDGTICSNVENSQYEDAIPDKTVVDEINRLYNNGVIIKIMTARGSVSKVDHTELTQNQLNYWGLKYHELIMNKKPYADLFIDDRGINISEWKKSIPVTYGILAGSFDLIHPGYIKMLQDAKLNCTDLTIALNANPEGKGNLVHSVDEREEILRSIKYVDHVIVYYSEDEFANILKTGNFDVRFLGDDYIDADYTEKNLPMKIVWINRDHEYSTTSLKQKIARGGNA